MINSRSDLQIVSENIPTYMSLEPEGRRATLEEIETRSQPIDIFVEKVPALRKSLFGNAPSDYKLVISGKKIVDWFMSLPGNNYTRQDLTKRIHYFLINPLKYPQSLYPVKLGEEFKDGNSEYRFLQDHYSYLEEDPSVINFSLVHYRQPISNFNPIYFYEVLKLVDKANVLKLLTQFTKSIKSIIETFGSPDGKLIDYQALLSSKELYEEFYPAVRSLAYIPFEPLLEDLKELKSTFINIYNIMQIHLILDFYLQEKKTELSTLERNVMLTGKKYLIGGQLYTLSDIEHGILKIDGTFRMKKPRFSLFNNMKPHFDKDDNRAKFTLLDKDPLVHFALNRGLRSCPGLKVYYAEKLNRQLKLAAANFCSREVSIQERNARLYITMNEILSLIANDFKGTRKNIEFLKFLANLLNAENSILVEKYLEKSPKKIHIAYLMPDPKINTFSLQQWNLCEGLINFF